MICASEDCENTFEKSTHNQKYCSDECCRIATNKKIRDKYSDLASWTKNKVIYINTENRTPDETYVYCLEQLKEKGLLK